MRSLVISPSHWRVPLKRPSMQMDWPARRQMLHRMHIPAAKGTPRQVAFQQAFIDEELPMPVVGALFGYPPCGLY